jgi:hypothetical protein
MINQSYQPCFTVSFLFALSASNNQDVHVEKVRSFAVLPSSNLFTAGVEGVYFHLITLRHTPQSVGLLWTRDRPVAETST